MSGVEVNSDLAFKRLRWQCRRGMKEMDALLVGWLERHYAEASGVIQHRFVNLLETEDDVLWRWLAGRGRPDCHETATLVDDIVACAAH